MLSAAIFTINAVIGLVLIGILAAPSSSTLRHSLGNGTAVPSVLLPFLASLLAAPLSVIERKKTRGGSMLLPLWLLVSLLFNACRIRTLNAIPVVRHSSFFDIYLIAFACQALMLAVENAQVVRTDDVISSTNESRAGFLSRLLFIWVFPLLWTGFRRPLEMRDLDALKPDLQGQSLANEFIASWTGVSIKQQPQALESQRYSFDVKENSVEGSEAFPLEKLGSTSPDNPLSKPGPGPLYEGKSFPRRIVKRRLLTATFRAFPLAALAPVPWRLVLTACRLSQPFLVSTTLGFVQSYSDDAKKDVRSTAQPVAYGWGLVGAYGLVYLGVTLATGQYWYSISQLMTKVRGAYVEAIYRKGLDLHLRVARTSGGGKAANLMSVDSERVVQAVNMVHELWSGCITIVVGIYLLYARLGLVFLACMVAVAACFFLTPFASRGIGAKQGVWSARTDKRVNLTSSIISDIKGVKLSAYEQILHAKICKARTEELQARSSIMKQIIGVVVFTNCTGEMLGLCTFITLIVVDKLSGSSRFDLNTVLTTLPIFGMLQQPLFDLGQQYSALLQAWESMRRIEEFLSSEAKPDAQPAIDAGLAASAACAGGSNEIDEPVDFAAKFERAHLGWATETVLADVDLEIPAKSLTMICGKLGQGKSTLLQALLGECDLLQGQQQLPLLAQRVAYVSQDVWLQEQRTIRDNIVFATGEYDEDSYFQALRACALIEDIAGLELGDATMANALSGGQRQRVAVARAVYSRAETYIFDDITSALDAETAAHMWRSLMGQSGLLAGKTVIMATNAVHLLHHAQLVVRIDAGKISESGRYEELSIKGKDAISRTSIDSQRALAFADPIQDKVVEFNSPEEHEDILTGSVGWKNYATWFKAAGHARIALYVLCKVFWAASLSGQSYYLQAWAESQQRHAFREWGAWIAGYICLIPMSAIFLAVAFWLLCVKAAELAGNRLHADELKGVLSAPLSFFSQWSAGQMTNRFSQDLYNVDQTFVMALLNTTGNSLELLATMVAMMVAAPQLIVVAVVLIGAAWGIQRLYLGSSLATIRGLKREAFLLDLNTASLDQSQKPLYHLFAVRRWLQTWLLLLTTMINIALVALAVVLRHSSQAGLFGVALVQATGLGNSLNAVVICLTEVEIAGVALERVRELSQIKAEDVSPMGAGTRKSPGLVRGDIHFDKVTVSYGPDMEPAIKELSFQLAGGKRLGIVGRSGSGKSTSLLALFGMIEIRSGTIRIDDEDIKQKARCDLRSQMSIVPQNPLVLAATIRENLDPEGTCSDHELWDALQKCELTSFVKKQANELEELLLTGDTFISTGQKQLLALARALLRKRKILVLDEATSAMDVETDQAVQSVLSSQFAECTVIAVAHRIATVMDFDQIICMSSGRAVEMGSPKELLQRRGEFWALACEQKCV
ncbi:hypothetical protein EX895_003180 [Sporisorium graminicola]|uniref:ABC transporter n=1 Tax=Sporisorium graminicola TaxID=280036 RepID=A0A4U7KU11_9BASI|nr:hypothetical protein EX895_003180 [Sporisorium graminicola]TKY88084.1 hypothetical protein EX895_003180 [Sporisorium graminicola]